MENPRVNVQFPFLEELQDQPSAWSGHMDFVYRLIQEIKPKCIVELGVHWGHSLFCMAQACRDLGLKTRITGIDHWQGDDSAGNWGEEWGDRILNKVKYIRSEYFPGQRITLVKRSFDDAIELFLSGRKFNFPVDVLHIDGSHDYESVRSDFDNYMPLVTKGGVILLHDVEVPHMGVKRLFSEIKQEHPDWAFSVNPGSFGLAVIEKKSE